MVQQRQKQNWVLFLFLLKSGPIGEQNKPAVFFLNLCKKNVPVLLRFDSLQNNWTTLIWYWLIIQIYWVMDWAVQRFYIRFQRTYIFLFTFPSINNKSMISNLLQSFFFLLTDWTGLGKKQKQNSVLFVFVFVIMFLLNRLERTALLWWWKWRLVWRYCEFKSWSCFYSETIK